MKDIYILLTHSTSAFSRAIGFFTKEEYTHSSVSFDSNLESMYSFARKYAKLPYPGGLIHEHLLKGYFMLHPKTPCMLLSLSVNDEAFEKAKIHAEEMLMKKEDYRYNFKGVILCHAGTYKQREKFYFCSEFVAEILKLSGIDLPNEPWLMHPQDFAKLSGSEVHYEGTVGELAELLYEYKVNKQNGVSLKDVFCTCIKHMLSCLRRFKFL